MSDRAETLVIGVGNTMRSDDGVGPWVAGKLSACGHRAYVYAGDGAGLIDLLGTASSIVLVDATRSGAIPGTLRTIDAVHRPLPADFFHYSTHRFGLAEAVETARALGLLPRELKVYGIEGECFDAGEVITAPVRRTASLLVEWLSWLRGEASV